MFEKGELIIHNRKVQGHACTLPEDEDIIVRYIDGGIFVDFRRKLRKLLMVSSTNPESKAVLKSTAQIRMEESRHLQHYYHMIHPFSDGRVYWEMIMILVYFFLLILIPIELCTKRTNPFVLYFKFTLDIISWIDISLFFVTGYYDHERQKIIMNRKKVIRRYVLGFFLIDALSSIPVNLILNLTGKFRMWPFKLILTLKLARIGTLMKYLRKFFERMEFWSYNLKLVNFGLSFGILIMWATSIVYLINFHMDIQKEEEDLHSIIIPMLESSRQVVMKFMLVGLGTEPTHKDTDITFQIFCLVFGSVLNMIMLAQIMQIYNRHSSSRNKYNNLIQQIGEYMKYKELPNRLREKVFHYVDFKFQKHIYKEADILNTLSSILKQDILLHNCKRLVEKVDFFKDLPTSLILRIVTKLKSEIYLPNDIIVQAGIAGNAMYFIYMGTVAVYTSTGKEICHLQDGSHFGEIALVINEPRVASVIAVKECELFRLSRRDFQEAIEPFPELSNKIRISALARLESTMRLMDDEEQVIQTHGDENYE